MSNEIFKIKQAIRSELDRINKGAHETRTLPDGGILIPFNDHTREWDFVTMMNKVRSYSERLLDVDFPETEDGQCFARFFIKQP